MDDQASPKQLLQQMIVGNWITQAVYSAAELGLSDLLAGGPKSVEELAHETGCGADALNRLLRALASIGIFAEHELGQFGLTPLAAYLQSNSPDSLRSFAILGGAELYLAWGNLLPSVRTGEAAIDKAFGQPFFQYLTDHPERGQIYDAAMTGVHGAEASAVVNAYDFSSFRNVVDVGGGNGSQLACLLQHYPSLKGILFDLPAVVERARALFGSAGLSSRCRFVGGDFFSAVPAGGDAYLLRHVIHDWDDERAAAVLRTCREAMGSQSRLLVVETVIQPGNEACFGKWLDLMMLLAGGRERTEEQYRRLFSEAGFELTSIVPTAQEVSVLEAVPG
jgi:hypothetical protein